MDYLSHSNSMNKSIIGHHSPKEVCSKKWGGFQATRDAATWRPRTDCSVKHRLVAQTSRPLRDGAQSPTVQADLPSPRRGPGATPACATSWAVTPNRSSSAGQSQREAARGGVAHPATAPKTLATSARVGDVVQRPRAPARPLHAPGVAARQTRYCRSWQPPWRQWFRRCAGWSPQQVADIRRVYVDQARVVVAIGERIRRAL